MVSVPPWKRMRVGSCLVRGEVLTLYLQQEGERPTVTPGSWRGCGSSRGLCPGTGPAAQAVFPQTWC